MKNNKWLILFIIFILFVVGFWLKISNTNVVKNFNNNQAPANQQPENQGQVGDLPQVVIGSQTLVVEVAVDSAVQKAGLSERASLDTDHGMLFVYPSKNILAFWMINMKFNIDLLWISDDKIVGIEKNMPVPAPNTQDSDLPIYKSPEAVNRVLEVNSGLVDKYGWKIGDKLEYKNINF